MKKINIVGNRYGRLLVLEEFKTGTYGMARCLCDCGNTKVIRKSSLTGGDSKSCGCYQAEQAKKRMSTKGGITSHPLYQRWYDMNRRCYDPARKDFHHYGGRGITVCDDWNKYNPDGFINFLEDMEESYIEGLEIDRINNDGNYCEENCKWSTRSEQVINSRNIISNIGAVRWLDDGEEILHLTAMAKKHNISPNKLQDRIGKLGWTLEDALSKEHKVKSYTIIIDDIGYKTGDVFFTNISNRCKSFNISTGQLLRSLFKDEVRIMAKINGTMEVVEYNELVVDTKPFKVKCAKFSEHFKDNYNIEVVE